MHSPHHQLTPKPRINAGSQLDLFSSSLSKKPYCSDDLEFGVLIRSLASASRKRFIQPNHPNSKTWLVFDVDRPISPCEFSNDIGLPQPHIFVQNPVNQHAHVFYGLNVPVHLNEDSSRAAMRFAGAVDAAYSLKMNADAGYSGLISKNPLHTHWTTWHADHGHYDLGEMAEYVDLLPFADRRKLLPNIGLGRNCNVFEGLRRWAYRAIRQGWPSFESWLIEVNAKASEINAGLGGEPLHFSEVGHIAKSVAKWTYIHFSSEAFSEIQSARGSRKGAKRRDELLPKVLLKRQQGFSVRDIAGELDIPKSTVAEWIKASIGCPEAISDSSPKGRRLG
jgi:hypothetical protein